MKSKKHADLVFYAHHPAALAAFRKHGYREGGYLKGLNERVYVGLGFYLDFVMCTSLIRT
jgi:hypothetical protein